MAAEGHGGVDPARRQGAQDVPVGDDRDVALGRAQAGDGAVTARGDVVGALAARRSVAPQVPVRALGADLRRGQALVLAVVPLQEVVVEGRRLEAGELCVCDLSAATGGFEDVDAGGGDKTYGDNLAAYFVNNADRLGILYVIWYRQIWMPGTGWSSYSGSGGPSATHTNHVHISML